MKRREIRALYHRYPDLLERALAIEDAARPNLRTVKGVGARLRLAGLYQRGHGTVGAAPGVPRRRDALLLCLPNKMDARTEMFERPSALEI